MHKLQLQIWLKSWRVYLFYAIKLLEFYDFVFLWVVENEELNVNIDKITIQ